MKPVIVGVDVGTGSAKACMVELRSGIPLEIGDVHADFDMETINSDGNVSEQLDVDLNWLKPTLECIAKAVRRIPKGHQLRKISLSGQMQCVVCVGSDGHVLRPAILHGDSRAQAESEDLERHFGKEEILRATTNYKGPSCCPAKLLWISRNEPEVATKTTIVLFGAHSFILHKLFAKALCDVVTAHTTSFLESQASQWWECWKLHEELKTWMGKLPLLVGKEQKGLRMPLDRFSEIFGAPGDDKLAEEGIEFFHGPGDLGSTTCGANFFLKGPYVYLGTSGWIATTNRLPKTTEANIGGVFRINHFDPPGSEMLAASMVTCGGNFVWAKEAFFPPETSWTTFDEAVVNETVGARGVMYFPYLNGERSPVTDPNLRASFVGLNPSASRATLARAVFEGVAFHLRWMAETLAMIDDESPIVGRKSPLAAVGGGSRSRVFRQILTDVFNCPIAVLKNSGLDIAALGAAIPFISREFQNSELNRIVTTPIPDHAKAYESIYRKWLQVRVPLR